MFNQLTNRDKIMGGIILLIILFFGWREWTHQRNANELTTDVVNYKDSAKYYNMKVDGMEVEVAYNKSLVLQNDKQLKSVVSAINDTIAKLVKKFKDIKVASVINNNTTIIGDTMKYKKGDSIPCKFKPFQVARDSAHYHFVGTISQKYFSIDTLKIPNQQSLVFGTKKMGFLKRPEQRAEIVNSNPLVKVTNIKSYVIEPDKKRIGIGASVGYGLQVGNNAITLNPYIGISLNYNLISF